MLDGHNDHVLSNIQAYVSLYGTNSETLAAFIRKYLGHDLLHDEN